MGPIESPRGPTGRGIGSVLRLPECLDLRRSPNRRRSAPVGSGKFVRQTAATERTSSTFHAARTPRRSGPSYNRRWPRRSGAFQYSHRREPVRQTTASLSGIASTPIGFSFRIILMSWGCRGASIVQAPLSGQPQGCLMSSPLGILLQNTHRGHAESSEEADIDSACRTAPTWRQHFATPGGVEVFPSDRRRTAPAGFVRSVAISEEEVRLGPDGGLAAAIDNQLLLPAVPASGGVNPASLTNGSTGVTTTVPPRRKSRRTWPACWRPRRRRARSCGS